MKILIRKTILFSFILLISAGCSDASGSYACILMFQDEEYLSQGVVKENEYMLGGIIGKVANKVKPETMPPADLWSNCLDKGTVLYQAKEDDSVILAEDSNSIYIFKVNEVSK